MDTDSKNKKSSGKRKRIKLECLECDKPFDNEYKQNHEKTIHNVKKHDPGKSGPIITLTSNNY